MTEHQMRNCSTAQRDVSESEHVEALAHQGYTVVHQLLESREASAIAELTRTAAQDEGRTGWRSAKKLHVEDLRSISSSIEIRLLKVPLVSLADRVFGGAWYVHGVRYRAPLTGYGEQTLHRDDVGFTGRPRLLTVIYPLVDFTRSNGATRVVPGSHLKPVLQTSTDPLEEFEGQQLVLCSVGSALVFDGTLIHSGTRNNGPSPRDAISLSLVRSNAGIDPPDTAEVARCGARTGEEIEPS
jgi:ectoine hydroxylase-related dioxygenase (phytanoyl-CoA dioxygenase family)